MNDGAARFAARTPVVWHVVEAEGEATVRRLGLLPAAMLATLAGRDTDGRNRADFELLALPEGPAVLRFQLMADAKLAPTLHGAYAGHPDLWRQHIDRHVFFWTTASRRDRFIRAVARIRAASPGLGSARPASVLELDTAALLARHEAEAWYSRINSGSTVRGGARVRRDETTFQPVSGYRGGETAELAVRGPVKLDGLLRPQA